MAHGDDRGSGKMPLNELISLWYSKGSPEPGSITHCFAEDAGNEDQNSIDSIGATEEEEDSKLPQLQAYRELILNSPSYQWLLSNLRRECMLAMSEANAMDEIRDYILAVLPASPIISRRKPPETFEVCLWLNWDPVAFCKEQVYTEAPEQAIERAITLTGTGSTAQALTCSQYMRQTWPLTGIQILQFVTAFASGEHETPTSGILPDGTTVLVCGGAHPGMWVKVCGTSDSIAEVGEQFAWMGGCSSLITCRVRDHLLSAIHQTTTKRVRNRCSGVECIAPV